MDSLLDENLMRRVKNGELRCAGPLFERYHKRIYGFFMRSFNNQADAQDATQTTFSRMLKYRASYREGSKFSTWLFTIAINQRNKDLTINQHESNSMNDIELAGAKNDEAMQLLKIDRVKRDIEKSLSSLPVAQREVLSLYLWQERDYQQLAEIFQTKVATMRVRVHRALQALRNELSDYGSEQNE